MEFSYILETFGEFADAFHGDVNFQRKELPLIFERKGRLQKNLHFADTATDFSWKWIYIKS